MTTVCAGAQLATDRQLLNTAVLYQFCIFLSELGSDVITIM
jgi:hypothetical protein